MENSYESRGFLDQYLLFHYGKPRQVCSLPFIGTEHLQFHRSIIESLLPVRFASPTRGLDIGCSVGRFSFELGRVVDRVIGIDSSKIFIQAARQMAEKHSVDVRVKESGEQFKSLELRLPKALQKSQVEFKVGDALDLSEFFDRPAHVVAVLNVLCRLPDPCKLLAQLERVVAPGGQLIIASPFSWLEQYTPREKWIDSSELTDLLRTHFSLAKRRELPFFIREHRRKYEMVVSEVSVFIRRR
jgi:SAM-dependent methyltransferase